MKPDEQLRELVDAELQRAEGHVAAEDGEEALEILEDEAGLLEALAQGPALGLALDQVNVKAKTAEKLGPVGQQQAMEARAAALLFRA